MRNAAHVAVQENDGNSDIAAVFDGTWQKRGHGVMTCISFDTGKVLDVECINKFCHGCVKNSNNLGKHEGKCVSKKLPRF